MPLENPHAAAHPTFGAGAGARRSCPFPKLLSQQARGPEQQDQDEDGEDRGLGPAETARFLRPPRRSR